MNLTLDPLDLKPEFQRKVEGGVDQAIYTENVGFEHLSDQAQTAVRIVGHGTFHDYHYAWNAIYPPKE
jgi:hypothetical protein